MGPTAVVCGDADEVAAISTAMHGHGPQVQRRRRPARRLIDTVADGVGRSLSLAPAAACSQQVQCRSTTAPHQQPRTDRGSYEAAPLAHGDPGAPPRPLFSAAVCKPLWRLRSSPVAVAVEKGGHGCQW